VTGSYRWLHSVNGRRSVMRWRTTLKAMVAAVAAAMVLAACGGSAGNKAGGDAAPVTLRIGTDDDPGRPGGAQIQEFARQVQQRSKGQVRIEPVWHAAGEEGKTEDWDQVVARKVVHGELDLGMIPARAWDTEGVMSLRALHAPFLVTSDQLVGRIVKGELAPEMLAGLEKIGVTGLALLPEGLRHVFAFGDPPLSPADYEGMVIRAPTSKTTYAAFETLGAKPDDFAGPGDRFAEGVKNGRVGGSESSFALAGTLPAPTAAVGNITFFPKVNSLVINTKVFEDLTEDQRAILHDAAQRAVDWAIRTTRSDGEVAKEYCTNGGRITLASGPEVARFQQAVEPVYQQLEQDAPTKALIARIRSLSGTVEPAQTAVKPCGPGVAAAQATPGDEAVKAFPEGVYRMEMPEEFLVQAGVDRPTAHNHAGIWTLTFKDGTFWDGPGASSGCPGSTYSVQGGRITIQMGPQGERCGTAAGKVLFNARWALQGDQLRFLDVRSGHEGSDLLVETLFGGKPFTRIG
jgi:TRAP-type C4-dicarboxylate transport system substrate-binding protein